MVFFIAATGSEAAEPIQLVLNADINSTLAIHDGRTQDLTGRVSAYLTRHPGKEPGPQFIVNAINIVYFGVPQAMVTGRQPKGKPTGVLGFSLDQGKEPQVLGYNEQKNVMFGSLRGQIDFLQIYEIVGVKSDPKVDDVSLPTQPASVVVRINPIKPLKEVTNRIKGSVIQVKARFDLDIKSEPIEMYNIEGYKIVTKEAFSNLEVTLRPWWEIAKRLCLQPVGIATERYITPELGPITIALSGAGLDFGMVGANTEWNKTDITFSVRDWILVHDDNYATLENHEEADLLSEIDIDDCIEIFFVSRFEPSESHGGGVTFNGGLASSKIISSDENAVYGIDLTHLAHELGHVVTLKHPGSGYPTADAPYRVDASEGTLMCPSGFMNDNPRRNSRWNGDHANNPLFTFALKAISPGPDCSHSENTGDYVDDCGNCP